MRTLFACMLVAIALAGTRDILAHDVGEHEVNGPPGMLGKSVALSGVVHDVVVDDEETGAHSAYRMLLGTDDTAYVLSGAAVATLVPDATYAVHGVTHGPGLDVTSAQQVVGTSRTRAAAAQTFSLDGTLRLGHMDFKDDRPSRFFFAVFDAAGQPTVMQALTGVEALHNGMTVTATGHVGAANQFLPDAIVVHEHATDTTLQVHAKSLATHSVLVIPVKFPTTTSSSPAYPTDPFPLTAINAAFFGALPVQSAAEFYKDASFGQQLLTGTVANNGKAPAGWLQAATKPVRDSSGHSCDIGFIASQAYAAARAAGYTVSIGANNNVFIVFASTGFDCGWSGLGYIGYGLSYSLQTVDLGVIGHELGHNFGLLHAGTLSCGSQTVGGSCAAQQYGDPYDIMGSVRAMHFNAFQKSALGWIPPSSVTAHTGGTATYTLSPIESGAGTQYAVKIAASATRNYWLEYHQPLGFDSAISRTYGAGVQIRLARPLEQLCRGCDMYSDDTELLDAQPKSGSFLNTALLAGSTFVDAYYGITVNVVAQSPAALTVSVSSLPAVPHADFDASGTSDLLWRNSTTGATSIWLMNGTAASSGGIVLSNPQETVTHTGDLDGDGYTDMISRNVNGSTTAWLMNGTTVKASAVLQTDPAWSVQFLADFDGDGKKDIVWRNSTTGATAIWLMDGVNVKSSATILADPAWTVTHVGDFNGDGNSDLVWYNATTGQTSLWLMDGLSPINSGVILTDPTLRVTQVGDFNGDGKSDLVWYDPVGGRTLVWLMNGLSPVATATLRTASGYHVTQIGDFDGDGKDDLLLRNDTTGDTTMWLMNGVQVKASASLLVDRTSWVTQIADTDGDGKSDLVWTSSRTGATTLWLMNGLKARKKSVISSIATMAVMPALVQ